MAGPGTDTVSLNFIRRLARRANSSFYFAFLTLPRRQREGILAVYAFCRAADNAVDEAENKEAARRELSTWREELDRAYRGTATHPIAARVGAAARSFSLPRELFEQVLDGVAMDIEPRRYATWEDLALYCDRVAGAVGRLCVRVFGCAGEEADQYAAELGAAFQLTNILRDLGADAGLGRFYLPQADLLRFGVSEIQVLGRGPERLPLLRFEAGRARAYFEAAARRAPRPELCAAQAMAAIYKNLLGRVERAGFPAWGEPVRVPRAVKLYLAARAWLTSRWAARRRTPRQ